MELWVTAVFREHGWVRCGPGRVGSWWPAARLCCWSCTEFQHLRIFGKATFVATHEILLSQLFCCCCCWVASVVSTSVRPHRRQPTRLPRPWDSPGKNTGVGGHFLLQCMKVRSESEVSQSCPTPRTAAHQAPPSMGFSRREHWSGVPLPSPQLYYLQ